MATAKKPSYWENAILHLSKRDTILKRIIAQYSGEMLTTRGDAFFSLARAIIGQQISVKAAESIWKKCEMGLGGTVTPSAVMDASTETLRACGLSGQKVIYLRELAQFFISTPRPRWAKMSDEDIMRMLIAIKGIGKWSVEMFMIFHLLRPDVFPVADLGLRKAVEKHYGKTTLEELSQLWSPYRTVATWYLWRSLDPVPVEY